jgi:nucleoside phosphorylase
MPPIEVPALSPDKYTVGWICAIPDELEAARNSLEVRHGALQHQARGDKNNYTLGSIKGHNVTIICLAEYGGIPAARAATAMQFTFPQLRFGLMVGVGGGIPRVVGGMPSEKRERDIRLGDVVVSLPSGQHGGLVQYDLGRMETGHFRRIGSLNKPPEELRTTLSTLRSIPTLSEDISTEVDRLYKTNDGLRNHPMSRPTAQDNLFKADAQHINDNSTCEECCKVFDSVVSRTPCETKHPRIHYGNIASGNSSLRMQSSAIS